MTFDPFGDFDERGYLRNFAGEKDSEKIKRLEHRSFLANVDKAFAYLEGRGRIRYEHMLEVHRILFSDVYPWAGKDRLELTPEIAVSKAGVKFARPADIGRSVEYGLDLGNDPRSMAGKPGEVMGYFAYGHPFLDGNGRTILVVHTALAERAGISIDWSATGKTDYLMALTRELDDPGEGQLDEYLKPYLSNALGHDRLADHILQISGLDSSERSLQANEVLGSVDDPEVVKATSSRN